MDDVARKGATSSSSPSGRPNWPRRSEYAPGAKSECDVWMSLFRKTWSGVSGAESFSGTASLITGGVDGADRDMPSEIFLSKLTGMSSWSW